MGTITSIRIPHTIMTIQNGIVRPAQIKSKEHTITSTHSFTPPTGDAEQIQTYRVSIESCDERLTDLLTRLISGVLFTNNVGIQNAEENILREMGKWNVEVVNNEPSDITKDPV